MTATPEEIALGRPAFDPSNPAYLAWARERLREPFPPEQIGKKPGWNTRGASQQASWVDCSECGRRHKRADFHLDFVGHYFVTERLLEADPEWTLRPLARDEHGAPILDGNGGLWVELTVLGVTRTEYGQGATVKAALSDALKRAAMRFGVGLAMWSKEEGAHAADEEGTGPKHPPGYADEEEWHRWRDAYTEAGAGLPDEERAHVKEFQEQRGHRWPFEKRAMVEMLAAIEIVAEVGGVPTGEDVAAWLEVYGDTLPGGPDAEPGPYSG